MTSLGVSFGCRGVREGAASDYLRGRERGRHGQDGQRFDVDLWPVKGIGGLEPAGEISDRMVAGGCHRDRPGSVVHRAPADPPEQVLRMRIVLAFAQRCRRGHRAEDRNPGRPVRDRREAVNVRHRDA